MKNKRVGIIGVGNVGSSLAFSLAVHQVCDEVLLKDIRNDFVQAICLDISQAVKANKSMTKVQAISSYEKMQGCDVIVITAGMARKPGMSRNELLLTNAKIMKSIVQDVMEFNSNPIFIIVSNPLDAMVYVALKTSKLPREQVLGMSGILDSSRMAHFISEQIEDKNVLIEALVMGGHGDEMVPLLEYSKINGKPLVEILTHEQIEDVVEKTKHAGAQIVKLLKTGSAYYAPAFSTVLMVDAIVNDLQKVFPCAIGLEGEYGYKNIVAGVLIRLGKNGCEEVLLLPLNHTKKGEFARSVNSVKSLISTLDNEFFNIETKNQICD